MACLRSQVWIPARDYDIDHSEVEIHHRDMCKYHRVTYIWTYLVAQNVHGPRFTTPVISYFLFVFVLLPIAALQLFTNIPPIEGTYLGKKTVSKKFLPKYNLIITAIFFLFAPKHFLWVSFLNWIIYKLAFIFTL